MSTTDIAVLRALVEQLADPAVSYVFGGPGGSPQPRKDAIDELLHAMPALLDEVDALRAAVKALKPLIEIAQWAQHETSPPFVDQPLVDAAIAATEFAQCDRCGDRRHTSELYHYKPTGERLCGICAPY